jgi:hypothetical protein
MHSLKGLRHVIALFFVVFWMMSAAAAVGAPPTVDPCTLLTKSEVEQIVGKLKADPKSETEGEARWCHYPFANNKDVMELWVFPADGLERARKLAKNATALKGVGEEAFLVRKLHGIDYLDLFTKKGDVTVKISLKETAGDEDKVKALAHKALTRF